MAHSSSLTNASSGLVDSIDILRRQSNPDEMDVVDRSTTENISRLASEDDTMTVNPSMLSPSARSSPPLTSSLAVASDVDETISLLEGVSPTFSRLMPLRRRAASSHETFEEKFDTGLKIPTMSSFEPATIYSSSSSQGRPYSMQSNDRVGRGSDRGSISPPELNGTGTKRSTSSLGGSTSAVLNPARTQTVAQSTTTLGSSSKDNILVSSSMTLAARSSLLLSSTPPVTNVPRKSRPSYLTTGSAKDKSVA